MNKYSDSVLAVNLILIQKTKFSFWEYLRAYLVKYLCLLVPVLLVYWFVKVDMLFFMLFFGLFVGAFGRDIGWLIYMKKTWSFQEKITDWEKVEELAEINADTK